MYTLEPIYDTPTIYYVILVMLSNSRTPGLGMGGGNVQLIPVDTNPCHIVHLKHKA